MQITISWKPFGATRTFNPVASTDLTFDLSFDGCTDAAVQNLLPMKRLFSVLLLPAGAKTDHYPNYADIIIR